jgi:hypothetical protein
LIAASVLTSCLRAAFANTAVPAVQPNMLYMPSRVAGQAVRPDVGASATGENNQIQ